MASAAPATDRARVEGAARAPWRRATVLLALVALAAGAVAVEAPLCPTAAFLGVPCPGCGLTRATLALLSGDLARALALHPLAPVMAPVYFALLAGAAISYVRGPRPGATPGFLQGRAPSIAAWIAVIALLAVWLARFAGAFGGPVPVSTLMGWLRS